MTDINMGKVFNDFGRTLPEYHDDFYAAPQNELTRLDIFNQYGTYNTALNYERFKRDYYAYVASLPKPLATKKTVQDKKEG